MSRSPIPLPPALGRTFSSGEARAHGVHSRRLDGPDVVRIARGLYARRFAVAPDPEPPLGGQPPHSDEIWRREVRARAEALGPMLPDEVFFSHRTAAALWGLPIGPPPVHPERLDASAFGRRPGLPRFGVAPRSVSPRLVAVTALRGVRLTDPATTWVQLAPTINRFEAIALGDAILHADRLPGTDELTAPPLATHSELSDAVRTPYRRGRAQLLALLPRLSAHAASPPESHLRALLEEWDFPQPWLDFDVRDGAGRLLGCSEIAYPEHRLALEYEGAHHFTLARQYARDVEKVQLYADAGWRVLRVTAELLYRRPQTLRTRLRAALASPLTEHTASAHRRLPDGPTGPRFERV